MVWTGHASARELRSYLDLIPPQWIERHSATSLWMEVHRVPYPPGPNTPDPPRCVDLGDVCATFVRTVLQYQLLRQPIIDIATPESWEDVLRYPPQIQIPKFVEDWVPKADDNPGSLPGRPAGHLPPGSSIMVVHNAQVVNHRTNLGTFVVLVTPHDREGVSGREDTSRERLRTAAGLLGALMGRTAVFEPLFDVEIDSTGNTSGITSPTFENPAAFREPDLSESGLGMVELCAARVSSLPAEARHRTELSLRWLYEAMHERDGVFAFLKYWIAIETLAMPDGTRIKPVIRQLAAAYGRPEAEVNRVFAIGRLFSVRGDIVHRGRALRVDQHLLAYIEAVYVDVFAHAVGGVSRMAEQTLQRSGRTAGDLIAGMSTNREPEPGPR